MKRYQLFSEYNDAIVWGDDLCDALRRAKSVTTKSGIRNYTERFGGDKLAITKVIGRRDTTGSTRGSWVYESAVCELEDGRVIEIDAREVGKLLPAA